jgi:hypothetical protein
MQNLCVNNWTPWTIVKQQYDQNKQNSETKGSNVVKTRNRMQQRVRYRPPRSKSEKEEDYGHEEFIKQIHQLMIP